jgi:inhibitor of cysteine peptidase
VSARQWIAFGALCAVGSGVLLAVVVFPWGDDASPGPVARGITPGSASIVHEGEEFVLWLASNPSTGYSWTAVPNPRLTFVTSRQIARSDRPGVPDTQQLTFRAVRTGTTTLKLAYTRPFEHGVPPAQTQTVLVTIRK